MRDVELYCYLLGVRPHWTVTSVELAFAEERVNVWVGYQKGHSDPCLECRTELPVEPKLSNNYRFPAQGLDKE